jgi:hypothetical protein
MSGVLGETPAHPMNEKVIATFLDERMSDHLESMRADTHISRDPVYKKKKATFEIPKDYMNPSKECLRMLVMTSKTTGLWYQESAPSVEKEWNTKGQLTPV